MKFPNVPSTSVKLMLFPFSLEGAARIWLEKEPPRSILTWDDLVNQPPAYQAPAYQAPAPQTQGVSKTDFESYVKANDAVMQNEEPTCPIITDCYTKIKFLMPLLLPGSGSLIQATPLPQLPPLTSCLPKVVESEPEVTKDTVPPINNGMLRMPSRNVDSVILCDVTNDERSRDFDLLNDRPPKFSGGSSFKDPNGALLIVVYEGELSSCGKDSSTFNLDQTLRYSSNYVDNSVNRIDIIELACEEYSQEVLGFSDVVACDCLLVAIPLPFYDTIISTSSSDSHSLRGCDFLLEEVDASSSEVIQRHRIVDSLLFRPEGGIYSSLLKHFSMMILPLPLPTQMVHCCLKFK
ncbi:hypothetical protein Tco_1029675 [Tanacetum coccineum]|uniref:Reverse transcriptase domain-containing protein n=1 Tax=Tanacetum coccineum TaxID=301880 RepID=A0ABQ5G441_9ASTR